MIGLSMKKISLFFAIFLLAATGCSIFGVHFKIHNPHRAGKFPKKTEARVLLGNQDSKYRTCYDVKWYRLNVDFGNLPKERIIKGTSRLLAVAKADFDTLQIDLAENLVIDKILVTNDNTPDKSDNTIWLSVADYYRIKNAVFIVFPKKAEKGKQVLIDVGYHGEPSEAKRAPWSGGFVRKEDNLKKPWWGVACETEGASLWWPCKDVMNDEPDSVDVHLTVPKGLVAVSNGILKSADTSMANAPRKTDFHWHVSYPINIYNITFYIGNYKLLHDTYYSEITHDTLQLNHYVLEQNYEKAKTHFQQLKNYLAFYEEIYGPYPWYRDGFKLVESPYAGMEHQSAIAYGAGYKNDQRYGWDYIILHETAHEWWGNSVTANDLAEGWIHEGFATYTEALYMERTKGHDAYLTYLGFNKLFIINRRPVVGEKGIRYFDYHDGDIYNKGAWVLHSLRYAVANDSLFFDILKSFYKENKYSQISSEKLEELVNRKTGKNFHWFFEQYLYNRVVPELEYCLDDNMIYYRWNPKCSKPDFRMQVKVFSKPLESKSAPVMKFDLGKLTPSDAVQARVAFSGAAVNAKAGGVVFNDNEFLFKPVENKSLARLAKKNKTGKY